MHWTMYVRVQFGHLYNCVSCNMFTLAAPADHNDGCDDTTTSNNRPVPELLAHNTGETNTATTHQHATVTNQNTIFKHIHCVNHTTFLCFPLTKRVMDCKIDEATSFSVIRHS